MSETKTPTLPPLLTDEQIRFEAGKRYFDANAWSAFRAGAAWAEQAVREALAQQAPKEDLPKSTPSAQWRADGEADPHGNRYDCERAALCMGDLTDDELANGAFLNFDHRPPLEAVIAGTAHMPIAWMTAVKDRIRWLSRALERATVAQPRPDAPTTWTQEQKQQWLSTARPGDRKPWVVDPSSEWPVVVAQPRQSAVELAQECKHTLRRDEIIALISPLSNNSADHDIEFAQRVIDRLATSLAQPAPAGDERAAMEDAAIVADVHQSTLGATRDHSGLSEDDKRMWDRCQRVLEAARASHPTAQAAVIECDCETATSPDGSRFTRCGSDQMRRAVEQGHAFVKAPAQAAVAVPETQAARDVLAERLRQVSVEGWTSEHDDEHDEGQLAYAAAGYAAAASDHLQAVKHEFDGPGEPQVGDIATQPPMNPWPHGWEFKPAPPRRLLVKAGALILAEIERLDRAAAPQPTKEGE